jgi:hypothetical protein
LAANIALGRDSAGVHFRSDSIEELKLGEEVGIGLLAEMSRTYNEHFDGFVLARLDGKRKVGPRQLSCIAGVADLIFATVSRRNVRTSTKKGRRALRRRPLLAAAGPARPVPPHSIWKV